MMKKIALAVVLSTTALSAMAEESKDFYAQVNAGYAFGMKSKMTFSNDYADGDSSEKFKTGKSFSFGLEGGAQINEYLRAGLSFDYMPSFKLNVSNVSSTDTSIEEVTAGDATTTTTTSDVNTFAKNPKIKSMNLMANLFIDAGNFSGFKPYAVVGLGIARNKASSFDINTATATTVAVVDTKTPDNNSSETTNTSAVSGTFSGKTKNNFAFKVGLGFKYAVNEDFDVDVRYQYLNLGKAKWNVGDVSSTVKLTANQLMLGVAYKF